MTRPEGVTADDLRRILAEVEGKVPTQRVLAGINVKDGVPQTTVAERYGVHRHTIANWLDRLERLPEEPFEEVVYDAERPGRPRKLTDEQRQQATETLRRPPAEAGIDAPAWTTALAQQYIADTFGIEYHSRHVRRLMHEAGLSYETTRPESATPDGRTQNAWRDGT